MATDMDASLDLSGIEESIHIGHSCEYGYYTADKSNYNKHTRRCKWHLQTKSAGPSTSTPAKPTVSSKAKASAKETSLEEARDGASACAMDHSSTRRRFICDTCGNSYKTKYGLKLHIKSKHEGTFKHQCSVCNKTFNQSVQYRYHCSKHLNVSIIKCPHCNRTFSSHGSLRRHLKTCESNTESYEKFKCDQCNAFFPHKYRLRYHQRGKHQPNRYICQGCNKRFSWRSSLKVHKRHCQSRFDE